MTSPTLDSHVRQISNIQFIRLNLEPLLPGSNKLHSTTINTYAAYVQETEHNNAFFLEYFVIFSSWLACIARDKIRDGGMEGLFAVHGMAALSVTIFCWYLRLHLNFCSVIAIIKKNC